MRRKHRGIGFHCSGHREEPVVIKGIAGVGFEFRVYRQPLMDLLGSVKALLDKERRLMALTVIEKNKELETMREQLESTKNSKISMKKFDSEEDWSSEEETVVHANPSISKDLQNLTILDLRDSLLNEVMLADLSQALLHAPSVKSIDISLNGLGEGSANIIAALISEPKIRLEKLNVSENRFNLQDAESICRAISRSSYLQYLDISRNPFHSDPLAGKLLGGLLATAGGCFNAIVITISDPSRERSSSNASVFLTCIFNAISSSITSIGIVHTDIKKPALSSIASLGLMKGCVTSLDFKMGFMGASGAAILAKGIMKSAQMNISSINPTIKSKFSFLENLSLKMNALGQSGCLWVCRAITASPYLKTVDLSSNDLDDYCAALIAKALEKTKSPIHHLDISRNNFYSPKDQGSTSLAEAVENHQHLRFLGKFEDLLFSVSIKRRIWNVMEKKAFIKETPKASLDKIDIVLFEDPERRALSTSNRVLRIEIPSTISSKSNIGIQWETSVRCSWQVLKWRDGELSVVEKGVAASREVQSTKKSDRIRTWFHYRSDTSDWQSSDVLQLNLEGDGSKGRFYQNICVRAVFKESAPLFKPSATNSNAIHSRTWLTRLLLPQPLHRNETISNPFQTLHLIYMHNLRGKISLEWNASIKSIEGKALQTNFLVGCEWRISKKRFPLDSISGDQNENRIVDQQSNANKYSVDLTPLNLCIGDTIELAIRPPDSALIHQRHKTKSAYCIESNYCAVLQHISTSFARLDLADAYPFQFTVSAWS